jgi:hypothetical protein
MSCWLAQPAVKTVLAVKMMPSARESRIDLPSKFEDGP